MAPEERMGIQLFAETPLGFLRGGIRKHFREERATGYGLFFLTGDDDNSGIEDTCLLLSTMCFFTPESQVCTRAKRPTWPTIVTEYSRIKEVARTDRDWVRK